MPINEKRSSLSVLHLKFQACCSDGNVILEPYTSLPDTLADLLTNNDITSKEFKKNARTYNSALSFTLMNADLNKKYTNN